MKQSAKLALGAGSTLAIAAALLVAGHTITNSPRVLDGWEFGGAYGCADTPFGGDNTIPCDVQAREIIAVGRAGLDERDPDHAAVVRAQIHGFATRRAGGGTGATVVVVFDLADGGPSAIGVGHPLVGPGEEHDPTWVAIHYGPMR